MANPTITTTIGQADPNAAPITVNDLITLLNQLINSQINGSYIPYIIQHDTPGVDDQDKAWIELDIIGRPIALKIWYTGNSGAWRRVYNGMVGEIRGYSGDPSVDFDKSTDPNNPNIYTSGKIGMAYDGWFICNGLNGTPNLSDKFLLGAAMDNVGKDAYSNGWQTAITGPDGTVQAYKTGGRFIETITNANLPLLTNAAAGDSPGLWIYGYEAKEAIDHPGTVFPLVDTHYANAMPQQWNLTSGVLGGQYGQSPPTPLWTTPPFYSLAWIIFKGYA